jgi:hypothetical protein
MARIGRSRLKRCRLAELAECPVMRPVFGFAANSLHTAFRRHTREPRVPSRTCIRSSVRGLHALNLRQNLAVAARRVITGQQTGYQARRRSSESGFVSDRRGWLTRASTASRRVTFLKLIKRLRTTVPFFRIDGRFERIGSASAFVSTDKLCDRNLALFALVGNRRLSLRQSAYCTAIVTVFD